MIIHVIGVCICAAFVTLLLYSRKFSNPYKLYMIFGKKGCGKTTYMVKLSYRYLKRGWQVYTTDYFPGTIHFEPEDFGYIKFHEDSVVLMDEVGIIFDSRNFKSFKPEVRNLFKYQRHCRLRVYLFSQTFDVDAKIRILTDYMYYLVNYFNVLTVCKRIRTKMVVTKADGQSESRIAQQLMIDPFFLAPFGARDFVWIPKWTKYFNSHETRILDLREYPAEPISYPDGMSPPWERKHRFRVFFHKN